MTRADRLAREPQRLGPFGIAAVSLGVMVANTVWPFTFGVLAPVLLDELSLTPGMFGLTYAVYYASASLGSPYVVRLSDRLAFRRAIHLMALGTTIQLVLLATATSRVSLLLSASLAGVLMAAANPATNSLITASLRDHNIRLAVAVKQSGVPVAAVLTGWLVPLVTGLYDWRIGVLSLISFALLTVVIAFRVTGSGPMAQASDTSKQERRAHRRTQRKVRVASTGLEVYALMLGVVTAGLNGYLPLFANTELAGSLARGGALLAAFAAAGAIGRVVWSVVGRGSLIFPILTALPGVGAVALFTLAVTRTEAIVWPLVVVAGFTVMAWQGIGTLALIETRPESIARTSGRMLQFFYVGFVFGAPTMGLVVERFGYVAAWSMLGTAASIACVSMFGPARARFSGPGLTSLRRQD
jgi:predicted MFS family arabinose efflux permease